MLIFTQLFVSVIVFNIKKNKKKNILTNEIHSTEIPASITYYFKVS